jgi:hypothetical protein
MTLDLEVICISGVPIAGIAGTRAASARQFILRDRKLVGLARLDHHFATVSLPDAARNRTSEVTMMEPVDDNLGDAFKCRTELRAAGPTGGYVGRFVKHCAAAPSCP